MPVAGAAPELPDDSIYRIGSNWVNQKNEQLNIADLQGKVQVMAFIYTYCEHSCPFIIANLKHIEKQISTEQQSDTRFLLISLDPGRDTPEVFRRYMSDHNLDEQSWTMLNGDPDDVLELSALIGVRYKPMDAEGKDIAHSNMITVLDRLGRIQYQMKGLNENPARVVTEIFHAVNALE